MWMIVLASGDYGEDIQQNLKTELESATKMNVSFADTFLRVQGELASDTQISQSKAQVENKIN